MVVKRRFYVCLPAAGAKFWDCYISRFENFKNFAKKTVIYRAIYNSPPLYSKSMFSMLVCYFRAPQAKIFQSYTLVLRFLPSKNGFPENIFRFFLPPDPKYVYTGQNGSLHISLYIQICIYRYTNKNTESNPSGHHQGIPF